MVGSDRILIVRVYAIGGFNDLSVAQVFTSQAGLPYLPGSALNGVVAEMGSQFSSEIPIFGSMGSDPTTYFSLLSNSDTLPLCLGRSTGYLRDAGSSAIVRVTYYVSPENPATIYCNDTTNLYANDIVRISGTPFRVQSVNSSIDFTATRIWDAANIPIAMQDQGTGQVVGAPIALLRSSGTEFSRGGIEQLPVVISTAPVDATSQNDEEVIFRGMIGKVTTDTSANGTNQIKVDCTSLLGMIRSAPFRPAPMSIYFQEIADPGGQNSPVYVNGFNTSTLKVSYRADIQGRPWDYFEQPYDSRLGVVQIRKDKSGGVFKLSEVADLGNGVDYVLTGGSRTQNPADEDPMLLGIPIFFNDGIYAINVSNQFNVNVGQGMGSGTPPQGDFLTSYGQSSRSVLEWFAEVSFVAENARFAVIDLLFGTFNADTTGAEGVRPAGMSAWLPFDWSTISDIIDLGELEAVLADDIVAALPILTLDYHPWPYQHSAAKTVGDVLDYVFKRTGCYMVFDRGRLRFNRWTTAGVWPTEINDTGLAEPRVTLNFDRNNSVQLCEIDWALSVKDKDIVREKYRVSNVDLLLSGAGKTTQLGNFVVPYGNETELANSQAMRDAVNMITRYSKAAAVVEVTYRDAVFDLEVGQFISFSSQYIPNALGAMGVLGANGFVLKAERSWKTPTTKYTLWLYGYLTSTTRLSVVSATGVWKQQISPTEQKLFPNRYTLPASSARPGAPTSDAAAFAETLARCPKGYLPLQLLDEYGTPLGYTSLLIGVDVPNDTLIFGDTNFDNVMSFGKDVLVIADGMLVDGTDGGIIPASWDAYQADYSGAMVNNNEPFPWMV